MFFEVYLTMNDMAEDTERRYLLDTEMLRLLARTKATDADILKKLSGGTPFYTTVMNVSEVFFSDDAELSAFVSELLNDVQVLGIHQRYAKQIPELRESCDSLQDSVFLSVAMNNKLTVLTPNTDRYRKFPYKKFNVKVT